MCCTTKVKIARAMRELMQERPLRKITVQDIMDRTSMKRQSFYYHFKDVYDVLEWEVSRQLADALQLDPQQGYEDWCMELLETLDRDRAFYRKAVQAIGGERALRYAWNAIRPHVCRFLFHDFQPDMEQLSEEEQYMADFFTQSICSELIARVLDREPADEERSRRRIQMLCRMAEQCSQIPGSLFNAS